VVVCDAIDDLRDDVIEKRDEIEAWVKDLVYQCNETNRDTNDWCDPYEVKEKIAEKLAYFDEYVQSRIDGLSDLADEVIEGANGVVVYEKECL
jgi:hypothetical protein